VFLFGPLSLLALLPALLLGVPARAEEELPPLLKDVSIEQNLDAQLPLDLTFTDESGSEVKLGAYFSEKPVLLTFVYYECPMLCTLVINGVVEALKPMELEPGKDFTIVTVSIDPGETPELAAAKKANYIEMYGREGANEGWHFLVGTEENIAKLAGAAGFRYAYNEETDEYGHASGIMLATAGGRLSHYFYGMQYPTRDLRLALVEASEGKIGSPVDRILLFCYHFDPVSGQYSLAVMNLVRAGAALTIAALASFMGVMFRREKRQRRAVTA
jgi:protein SCO1/2